MKSTILIESGLLHNHAVHQTIQKLATSHVLVYDRVLEKQLSALKNALQPLSIALQAGEACKSREVRDYIEDTLISANVSKDTVLIACGGGTVLDVAGFVAATYCRGLKLCYFPSTLLAMADAAIGGKNGINVAGFKNCVGTIYHPQHVFIDTDLLHTLSEKEMQNGRVEILKLSLVTGCDETLESAIRTKLEIVEKSETRAHIRDLLNFGHTFGHAYEALMDFQVSHGEAVLVGMAAETFISHRLGHLSKEAHDTIQAQIAHPKIEKLFSKETWLSMLKKDKKNSAGNIHMVLLRQKGVPVEDRGLAVPESYIEEAIDWMYALHFDLCRQ